MVKKYLSHQNVRGGPFLGRRQNAESPKRRPTEIILGYDQPSLLWPLSLKMPYVETQHRKLNIEFDISVFTVTYTYIELKKLDRF